MKNRGPWKCRSDGQRGKPKAGFPRCPQPLEIADAISTFPPPRRRVEKWKTNSRFSTFPFAVFLSQHQTNKGGLAAALFSPQPPPPAPGVGVQEKSALLRLRFFLLFPAADYLFSLLP